VTALFSTGSCGSHAMTWTSGGSLTGGGQVDTRWSLRCGPLADVDRF
jgi:hypothetical protein